MLTAGLSWTNPMHPRLFGGVLLLMPFFSVVMIRKKEWEEVKMTLVYFICMILSTIIIEIAVTIALSSTLPAASISQVVFEAILMGSLIALGVYSYITQER